jgi:hypothetical protein
LEFAGEDGSVLATRELLVEPGSEEGVVLVVSEGERTTVVARVVPYSDDALVGDNEASVALPAPRPLRAWVDADLHAWHRVLLAMPDVELVVDAGAGAARPDLAVYASGHEDRDAGVVVFDGSVPPVLEGVLAWTETPDEFTDWDRDAAVMRYAALEGVVVRSSPVYGPGSAVADLEAPGFEILAHGRGAPLVLQRVLADAHQVWFLFPVAESTLPFRVAFPVIAGNLVDLAGRAAGIREIEAHRTGVLDPIPGCRAGRWSVRDPAGRDLSYSVDPGGHGLTGVLAPLAGAYRLQGPGGDERTVHAGLLNAGETMLGTVDALKFREGLQVPVAAGAVPVDKPLWRWILVVALVGLAVEWWWFLRG